MSYHRYKDFRLKNDNLKTVQMEHNIIVFVQSENQITNEGSTRNVVGRYQNYKFRVEKLQVPWEKQC